jgi:hypothetical protein
VIADSRDFVWSSRKSGTSASKETNEPPTTNRLIPAAVHLASACRNRDPWPGAPIPRIALIPVADLRGGGMPEALAALQKAYAERWRPILDRLDRLLTTPPLRLAGARKLRCALTRFPHKSGHALLS